MSQSSENKQKLMKPDNIKQWVDVLKCDKDRKHHEETLLKCLFSPFLFGTSYLGDKWIRWGVETKLFKDASHPNNIIDKLEGPYFDVLDTVTEACKLVCKKLAETKAVDLQSVLVLSEKTNKCTTWKQVLQTAENNDFFSKLKKQLEAVATEKSEKIGMALIFAIKQYADYVVESVVKERNFSREMENLGPEDVVTSWHREGSSLIQIPVNLLTGDGPKNYYRTRGNEAFKVGRFNDALSHYTEAIKNDRFNYILYSNRAQTNLNLRKFQEALCDARRAVILKPDWPKPMELHWFSCWWYQLCVPETFVILIYVFNIVLLFAKIPLNNPFKRCRQPEQKKQGHYRYAQAFYELGKTDKAKEVNRNGLEICRKSLPAPGDATGNNPVNYLQIQADKFSEKESEEDEVPELVEASSSNSDSAESEEEEEENEFTKTEKITFDKERQQIDVAVLQKILKHKEEEDEKERLKKERKEEQKRRMQAEEEKRKKQEEARRKKKKEEKEKQKEAEKAKKAEKKRREEEKQQAEKARMEKLAAKHELENMLKQGSEAYLDKRGRQAVTFYQKVQELISQSTEQWGGLREEDYVTYLYAWGIAGLESGIAKEVHDAAQRFETILNDHAHVRSPLAYYGLAYTYFKHCKFQEAFEPLDKGEQMAKKFAYVVETWPGTNHSIKETTKGQMELAIDNLRDRCKNPPQPDAICRHGDCPSKREIYLTDPEFKGYVSTSCSEHCVIEYHVACWKKAKADWEGLVHDKDVINKPCNTPDCLGDIITLTIYGADGFPRTEAKSDQAKKEKEKVKTKGKNKTKQEKKRQKKQETKKNSEKGQGDGEKLESISSSQGDKEELADQLLMPKRAERRDDDTISTTSSNDVKRQDTEGGTVDGDEDSQAADISDDIDDILDDDLPISIPDATYVLKRDDFGEGSVAAKKSKPKMKMKKKKSKAASDLNIQLQFVDDGQRSLMTSDDVLSPEADAVLGGATPYTPDVQENPFAIPEHLKEQATDFERSLPNTFSQMVKGHPTFPEPAQPFTETDEQKSQKMAILFHLSDLFDKLGPVLYNDPRLEMEMDKLPEAQPVISRYGGLRKFLLQSPDFFVLEDHVSLARDTNKCREMFMERNNRLKDAGLPPPPITGFGFGGQLQKPNTFPPGSNNPILPAEPYPNITNETVVISTPNQFTTPLGSVDALDNFDLPSNEIDDIDDITDAKVDVVVSEHNKLGAERVNRSGSLQNQDLDQELDRVLASQQLDGGASLQSLNQGLQPFPTNHIGSFEPGVKAVSVDISGSLSAFDSGLGSIGSMQNNICSDKKALQNDTGTHSNADLKSAALNNNSNSNVGDSTRGISAGIIGGGIGGLSKAYLHGEHSTDLSVESSDQRSKTDSIPSANGNSEGKGVRPVRDFADGVDTGGSVDKSAFEAKSVAKVIPEDTIEKECDNGSRLTTNNLGTKSPVIEVDISDKISLKSDQKLVDLSSNEGTIQLDKGMLLAEYQKLQARYKLVHNACKHFQEKRKNMKSIVTQTIVVKFRSFGMNTEPFMEFEELKVTKERLQVNLHENRQKYIQLQMNSNNQIEMMKTALEKKDAKEKELSTALEKTHHQCKQLHQEITRAVEDMKTRDLKIQELEAEKILFQKRLTAKEHELEELTRKSQIERDHWTAEKLKLQDAFQTTERNQKMLLKRAIEAEIVTLQLHCKTDTHGLETWLREGEFHLNNFKMNLQRTPDNLKMKEGYNQWQKAVSENKKKLELLKGKYDEQIRQIQGGRLLAQLPSIEVPQITKPSLPPLPPPGAFMGPGPRPGFMPPPPQIPPGIRPPLDINTSRSLPIPNSAPSPTSSPSPVITQATSNPITSQTGPISVPVSLADVRSSSPAQSSQVGSQEGKVHTGPAKVTPAQVTVPLQEQAPWPPAATTPPHSSPPGFPVSQTPLPTVPSTAASNLGAVGTRPQSVAGANAAPGNNRPVRVAQEPSTVGQTAKPTSTLAQPRTNFERILFPLQTLFPKHNQVQLTKAIKEVRQANNGSLSGLSVDEIIRRSASILKHQQPLRPPVNTVPAGATPASASGKTWQNNTTATKVPQGQRLVQGVMQGIAAQQGKFQWTSELGGASSFGTKGILDDEEDPCVICHEEMTPETTKILECGHRFHEECIKQWLNEQSTCPNCRNYTLLPDEYPSLN